MEERVKLTAKEVEHLRHLCLKYKDKATLKRLRKHKIKPNEYRWHVKEFRKQQ